MGSILLSALKINSLLKAPSLFDGVGTIINIIFASSIASSIL